LTIPRSLLRVLRWLLVLALVSAALWTLRGRVPDIVAAVRSTEPRWGLVAVASLITLAAYLLLIESWRRTLGAVGGWLPFGEAAIIWFGSNLARYLPGAGWQLGLMGAMARERGVGVAISTAASAIVTIANILTGLAVCLGGLALLAVGPQAAPALSPRALGIVVVGVVGLLASPWLLPRVARIISRLTGRVIEMPRISLAAAMVAGVGTAVAWIAYGVAFWVLARAILPGDTARSVVGCITLYTFSYLVGLFNPMPAGIGVTEPVIVLLAPQLGVATTPEAIVLALFVRAWRTVMEMAPSLVAIGIASARRRDRVA
jgi:uncharacterized membrane protein YbhN (UPF0104 family)